MKETIRGMITDLEELQGLDGTADVGRGQAGMMGSRVGGDVWSDVIRLNDLCAMLKGAGYILKNVKQKYND